MPSLRNLLHRPNHHPSPSPASASHTLRGASYSRNWTRASAEASGNGESGSPNTLQSYFESHTEGRGIWKWNHYFEIYTRHLAKFVGREVHCLEIGVYSGGSLDMWKHYFGPGCVVYGVDVQPACQIYEDERTRISIGDQADRTFWKDFKEHYPVIDILIDDGSHKPEHQITTLEEMLPHLGPGGVYLCEDIHGNPHGFSSYIHGLAASLNAWVPNSRNPHGKLASSPTPFQAAIHSVHIYPYAAVIEKNSRPLAELVAPKHGTEWQPFLDPSTTTSTTPAARTQGTTQKL